MKKFQSYIKIFEDYLDAQQFDKQPNELYKPIQYTLSSRGKRIRPILTLMACEMFNGDIDKVLPQAIAIELFHNFTLIHDDIMDDAPIRRGKDTVYKKWNTNVAILSGDTLFALAYRFAQQADKEILPEILNVFNNTAIEVCEGQQFDLNFETNDNVTVEEYIEMIGLKTAVLFGASLKIGSLIAGASEDDARNLYNFGLNIGIGFQLKDDLLDTFGNENIFGKKTGIDILTNKKTFLYLKALELADPEDKRELIALYRDKEIGPEEKIERVVSIYKKLKIFELTNNEIDFYFQKGTEFLESVSVKAKQKEKLRAVALKMINRDK